MMFLFDGKNLGEQLVEKASSEKKNNWFVFYVSKVFEDTDLNHKNVVVWFNFGNTFYEKAEHIKTMAMYTHEKMNPGIDTPSWMSTTNNVNICAESHGLSSLCKMIDKNGNTIACVSFVFQVPLEAKASILDELVINVRDIYSGGHSWNARKKQ